MWGEKMSASVIESEIDVIQALCGSTSRNPREFKFEFISPKAAPYLNIRSEQEWHIIVVHDCSSDSVPCGSPLLARAYRNKGSGIVDFYGGVTSPFEFGRG
jgi:hypothetical protein